MEIKTDPLDAGVVGNFQSIEMFLIVYAGDGCSCTRGPIEDKLYKTAELSMAVKYTYFNKLVQIQVLYMHCSRAWFNTGLVS